MFDDEIERICEVDLLQVMLIRHIIYILFIRQMDMRQAWMLLKGSAASIEEELEDRLDYFDKMGKPLEKKRLEQRCRYDIEALKKNLECVRN